ncbi:MAG: CTP synthase, partial [Actinomycetota bacterium]
VCRSDRPITQPLKKKLALFCDVDEQAIVSAVDADTIYDIPMVLRQEGLDDFVVERLGIETGEPDLSEWENLLERVKNPRGSVRIGLVGKYVNLVDAYLSVVEALYHGGFYHRVGVEIAWIASDDLTTNRSEEILGSVDGILVPGGFGFRGIEGKIAAARFARERRVPFLGICLGLQVAVIDFARHVAGLENANSSEFDEATPHPVIDLMRDQRDVLDVGGTMRLGLYPCRLAAGSVAAKAYGQDVVFERHRHRYEVNNRYRKMLEEAGLVLSGTSPDGRLVEMIENPAHPWFVGSQFHPEFKSRPNRAHPLFRDFVGAAVEFSKSRESGRVTVEAGADSGV